jgi:hypothetical protein
MVNCRKKNHGKKDLDNEDKVVAATVNKDIKKKTKNVNPDKDKACNHCKKKGHTEKKCWKKHPEMIPDKLRQLEGSRQRRKPSPLRQQQLLKMKSYLTCLIQRKAILSFPLST